MPTVCRNSNGGWYECGRSYSQAKWISTLHQYDALLKKNGKCSVRQLAKEASISIHSAHRVVKLHKEGKQEMPKCQRGHGRKGIGSKKAFTLEHHAFLYQLYRDNPSMPLYGYVEELLKEYSIKVSDSFIKRWFDEIGPHKGTLRVTSSHPSGRYSTQTIMRLQNYLAFISSIDDHTRLVFSDEKPMKEVMIFPRVRKDPFTGECPKNISTSTSKNRFNILAAVNLKGGEIPPVYWEVIEECTNAALYLQFVKRLVENGILQQGDIFVVDNCSIHYQGDNIGLPDALWNLYQIRFIALPPYSPEFNPTELVFNCLQQRLKAERARYKAIDAADFLDAIKLELDNFDLLDVVRFYKKCGYLK